MLLAANPDIWRWQAHPEVWLIVVGALALGWYATRVIGPKVVAPGETVVTGRQTAWYLGGVFFLWLASDWPLHDLAEEYLYSLHMVQHMIISFIVPPMLLLAMPEWLARLVVSGDGSTGVWIRRFAHPVVAGVVFNVVQALSHLPVVVETSVQVGVVHYLVHFVVFSTALLMWVPVVSPLPELRLSAPGRMVYLFLMSVLPTVPAGFLTVSGSSLYEPYDHDVRLWGISVTTDQQLAGLVMKLGGGLFLWTIIAVTFFRWAYAQMESSRPKPGPTPRPTPAPKPALTYEQVAGEFDRAGPAPSEPSSRPR